MDHNLSSGSLDLMQDIIIPPAISFWPLASGWYALGLIVLSFLFYLFLIFREKRRVNLYRREALQRLKDLKDIKSVLSLLKGVALHRYTREDIASLSQDDWWDFVQEHSKVKADTSIRKLSQAILYNPNATFNEVELQKVKKLTKVWIQTHRSTL